METNWKLNLKEKLNNMISLSEISDYLRFLKKSNISQEHIKLFLNELRNNNIEEVVEDRILEILDIVEGYCQPEYKVW